MYSTSNFFQVSLDAACSVPFKVVSPKPMTAKEFAKVIYTAMNASEMVLFDQIYPEAHSGVSARSVPTDTLLQGFLVVAIDIEKVNAALYVNYEKIQRKIYG